MGPLDALSLVEMTLSLCKSLYHKFQTTKSNPQLCEDLAKKVQSLHDLVGTINQSGRVPSHVCRALKALCKNLQSANGLMDEFYDISPFFSFLKSDSIRENFSRVDKKLQDSLQILSTALQVQHGKMLDRVYDTLRDRSSCSRPPLPDLQTSRSPSAAVPAAYCGVPMTGVAAAPSMVPTSALLVPQVFPGVPTTSSFSVTSTTFVSPGVSSRAVKAALKSMPQINIDQIYAAEQPAVTVRCSLLPSKSRLRKI